MGGGAICAASETTHAWPWPPLVRELPLRPGFASPAARLRGLGRPREQDGGANRGLVPPQEAPPWRRARRKSREQRAAQGSRPGAQKCAGAAAYATRKGSCRSQFDERGRRKHRHNRRGISRSMFIDALICDQLSRRRKPLASIMKNGMWLKPLPTKESETTQAFRSRTFARP